ncbi:MAG: helix-turn-helix transcriptional regulator [Patescibacteria group bacterium]|nr:helix-turn-helix transcriptional regulator [Patescibacteria group bacterium]
MDLRELKEALDREGRGARVRLARELELDPSTVKKILDGKRRIRLEEAPVIERFVREADGPVGPTTPTGMVQVYGFVAAAGELINLAEPAGERLVPIHPAQRGYPTVGAAEVIGESMLPRYKPRELVYFVFGLKPRRGDDAIVEMNDGTAILKEYVMEKDGRVSLREFHPEDRTFTVPGVRVKALHAVVGRG